MEVVYTLHYSPEVAKDIKKIPVNLKGRIKNAIETRLLHDPIKYSEGLRRSLKDYRKLRVGDYRVIFKLIGNEIIIFKIGHRKEVYSLIKS